MKNIMFYVYRDIKNKAAICYKVITESVYIDHHCRYGEQKKINQWGNHYNRKLTVNVKMFPFQFNKLAFCCFVTAFIECHAP